MRTITILMHPLTAEYCYYVSDETGKTISIWDMDRFGDAVEIMVQPTKEDSIFNSFFD